MLSVRSTLISVENVKDNKTLTILAILLRSLISYTITTALYRCWSFEIWMDQKTKKKVIHEWVSNLDVLCISRHV